MSIFRKILAIFIPVSLFLGTLFFLFKAQEKIETKKAPVIRMDYKILRRGDDSKYSHNPQYMAFMPKTLVQATKFWDEEVVYKVTYDLDELGLRNVPGSGLGSSHVIHAGCSFTYGEGLPIEESFPAIYQGSHPEADVTNFSQGGGGLHMMLRFRDFISFNEFSQHKKGMFLYHFMSDHLNRWFADASYLQWAPKDRPFYVVENGVPVFKGEVQNQKSYQDFQNAKELGIEKTFIKINGLIQRKNSWSDKELTEFTQGLLYLKKLYLKDFPEGQFAVVLHPMVDLDENHKERFMKILAANGIPVKDAHKDFISYLNAKKIDPPSMNIKHDGHPAGPANFWFSEWLSDNFKTVN